MAQNQVLTSAAAASIVEKFGLKLGWTAYQVPTSTMHRLANEAPKYGYKKLDSINFFSQVCHMARFA